MAEWGLVRAVETRMVFGYKYEAESSGSNILPGHLKSTMRSTLVALSTLVAVAYATEYQLQSLSSACKFRLSWVLCWN